MSDEYVIKLKLQAAQLLLKEVATACDTIACKSDNSKRIAQLSVMRSQCVRVAADVANMREMFVSAVE